MKSWIYFFVCILLYSCSSDSEEQLNTFTLAEAIGDKEVVLDNVIACAASTVNDVNSVDIFLYPRLGVRNVQFYEAIDGAIDKNDFTKYTLGEAPLLAVFNGFLQKFVATVLEEKWVIVTFEEDGKMHISNPINLKHKTKPTEYTNKNITIDKTEILMPKFSWVDGIHDDTKIYFEVISDNEDNFISGTYTFEKMFQYYKLDNVVLNITQGIPPNLINENDYNFSLLAVSEDNWVNLFSKFNFNTK